MNNTNWNLNEEFINQLISKMAMDSIKSRSVPCESNNKFLPSSGNRGWTLDLSHHPSWTSMSFLQRLLSAGQNVLTWVIFLNLAQLNPAWPHMPFSHQLSARMQMPRQLANRGVCSCVSCWFRCDERAKPSPSLSWVTDVSHPRPWELMSSVLLLLLPSSLSFS